MSKQELIEEINYCKKMLEVSTFYAEYLRVLQIKLNTLNQ
jgi:hypothetical protein